jgi:hypothetical protein
MILKNGLKGDYLPRKRHMTHGEAKRIRELRQGLVYIVWMETTPYYKIGFSKDPEMRMSSIFILPVDLIVIHTIVSNFAARLEAELHGHFEEKRVRGEWFKLTEDDLIFLKTIEQVDYDYEAGFVIFGTENESLSSPPRYHDFRKDKQK